MAFNALKPVALRATVWRPSSMMKLVKTPSRGLAEISQPLSSNKPVGAFRGGYVIVHFVLYVFSLGCIF